MFPLAKCGALVCSAAVILFLQWSAWAGYVPGDRSQFQIDDMVFYLRYVPAASFPTHVHDTGSADVDQPFWIGEHLLTYDLWYSVVRWAEQRGYDFANPGLEGSAKPVTMISWRDALVWCNALSHKLGYDPVYVYQGEVFRNAGDLRAANSTVPREADGFRLPTRDEWELAARYQDGMSWTPGNRASGAATADPNPTAWYNKNSGGQAQAVGLKAPNALGLYDMSGNVWELCCSPPGTSRIYRGGSWANAAIYLRVGFVLTTTAVGIRSNSNGLRIVRTASETD